VTFNLTIIGSGSGAPLPGRFTSAQVLNVHERFVLIDCGEGTQINLRRFGINFNRIELILISHLHGDHYLGLPGLLNTFHLLGRTKELHIAGHRKLKELIDFIFKIAGFEPSYPIHFHVIDYFEPNYQLLFPSYSVNFFSLLHRIKATGFRISEIGTSEKISKEFIAKYKPDIETIQALKTGNEFFDNDGNLIPRSEIFIHASPPRSFAYASDTVFSRDIIPHIENANLLYHEATYASALQVSAVEKMHSTSVDAATIALEAKVKKLAIGHFSSRYKVPDLLLEEAKAIFPNTIACSDGLKIEI
jgi:ribonuclease Z